MDSRKCAANPASQHSDSTSWVSSEAVGSRLDAAVLRAVEAALDLPPAERRNLLLRCDALDAEARARAFDLLSHCESIEAAESRQDAGNEETDRVEVLERGPLDLDLAALVRAAAPEAAAALADWEGRLVGPFRIVRFIAAGGMGEVYEAVDTRIGRQVALKMLPRFASVRRAQRFADEARAMARLEHPAIARLYEWSAPSGAEGVPPYIVMEFIDGVPLAETANAIRLRGGGADEVVRLLLPVIDAVAYSHARGVLHRDIKPGNILVDRSGLARLLDFGVAAILDDDGAPMEARTNSDAPGTLNYMSPEQVRGGDSQVTVRSDVYALGLVLYECLAGRPANDPRGRSVAEVIDAALRIEPPPLAWRAVGPGSDLDFILRRALAKEPDDRYPTADALSTDLRRFLAGVSPADRSLGTLRVLRGLVRRNRRGIAITAILAAAVAVAAGFGAVQFVRAREAQARTEVLVGQLLEGSLPLILDLHIRLRDENQPLTARRAAGEATVRYLEWVLASSADDARVMGEVGRHYRALAHVVGTAGDSSLGDTALARTYYERSLEILERALPKVSAAHTVPARDATRRLLMLRSDVLREYAGLLDEVHRPALFEQASADQRAALELLPEGEERDDVERFLLTTQIQGATLRNDAAAIEPLVARFHEMAARPRLASDAGFLSELGLAERYFADVLEAEGRIVEAVARARIAGEAFERSIALGQDDFTNRRHLARVEMLVTAHTAPGRSLDRLLESLIASLERSRTATNLKPESAFHRLSHLEAIHRFAEAQLLVVECSDRADPPDELARIVARALEVVDQHLAYARGLPTEGVPHRGEPDLLAKIGRTRDRLDGVGVNGGRPAANPPR